MQPDQSPGLWDQLGNILANFATGLAQLDPQYLLLAMAVLIWLRLGRIGKALVSRDAGPAELADKSETLRAALRALPKGNSNIPQPLPARSKPAAAGPVLTADRAGRPASSRNPQVARRERSL